MINENPQFKRYPIAGSYLRYQNASYSLNTPRHIFIRRPSGYFSSVDIDRSVASALFNTHQSQRSTILFYPSSSGIHFLPKSQR